MVVAMNQSTCKNSLTYLVLDIATTVSENGFFTCSCLLFQVIRKVDKQTALLDADDPVSQLHKVNSDCTSTMNIDVFCVIK